MCSPRRKQRGSIMVVTIGGLVAIFGVSALAIDGAYWYERRAEAQRVADCAAISAAYVGSVSGSSAATTEFNSIISASGYDPTDTANNYMTNPYRGSSGWYNVHVGQTGLRIFSGAIGVGTPKVGASATAQGVQDSGLPNIPDAAVTAAGNATFGGGSSTTAATGSYANVYSNGIATTNSGSVIDGAIYVPTYEPFNTSVNPYNLSVGNVGNNTLDQLPSPVNFSSSTTIAYWNTNWMAAAQSTGNTLNGYHASNSQAGSIIAPAYVNGNIQLTGSSTLSLVRQTGAVGPQVIYVNGSVSTSGSAGITNNGVIFVVTGDVNCTGTGVSYQTTDLSDSGLISLAADKSAMNLSGSGNATIGFVYAVNGDASLSGNGTIIGSLISGATDSNSVVFTGNALLSYPSGLTSNKLFPSQPGLIATSTTGLY